MLRIDQNNKDSIKHILMLIGSFTTFGFLPIYWSHLSHIDADEVLFYRTLTIALTLLPVVFVANGFAGLVDIIKAKWFYLMLSSVSIAVNWLTFIYAINNQHVFEGSLGYFLTPLVSVLLGYALLKERVSKRQFISIAMVFSAIIYLVLAKGIIPKYALIIALTFSAYGILGRALRIPVFARTFIESTCITVLLFFIIPSQTQVVSQFLNNDSTTKIFLLASGPVSILPLCLYSEAVSYVKLSTAGMLSFLLPTIVFFVSIFYFHEGLDTQKLITIMVIWPSIGIYVSDLFLPKRSIKA